MSVLQWVRARQRDLTKAVLALFCLAWLQAAAVPCVMAADGPASAPAPHHCQYCPPPAATADTGHHDSCAFPHEPQVDARAASGLFCALPVMPIIAMLDAQPLEPVAVRAPAEPDTPATAFAVSYCRLLL